MKKFYKIFIVMACLLLGVLSSCDYLDVVPDEKATEKMRLRTRKQPDVSSILAMLISPIRETAPRLSIFLPLMRW